jgi:hypothetical protein
MRRKKKETSVRDIDRRTSPMLAPYKPHRAPVSMAPYNLPWRFPIDHTVALQSVMAFSGQRVHGQR